jgi:hypothetical protein
MFAGGSWVVRSITNPTYCLDSTPKMVSNKWSPQVIIYDGKARATAHTLCDERRAFETPQEAAEAARALGERWLAQKEPQ